MIAAINTKALEELALAAPLAVLAVTVAWGMVVHGATRAWECTREGRSRIATLYAIEAISGAVLFTAAVVLGLLIMTTKD
ncbi:MAG: hypothetical protein ACRDKY_04495 [Solirubrobacteraceae bacterium]